MALSDLATDELLARLQQRRKVDPALGVTERRAIAVEEFEVRATGTELRLRGYASVFDYPYEIAGGPSFGGFTEIVDRRAFDQTLKQRPDVMLLVNHDGTPLARTKSGTLTLGTDDKGLHVDARLDPKSPAVQTIRSAMERRDMDEMSFAFRTVRHEFDEAAAERRLLEVNIHKGDVSIVNYGASDATSAQIRTLGEALDLFASLDAEQMLAEVRSLSDPTAALVLAQRNIAAMLRGVSGSTRLSVAAAQAIAEEMHP